MNKIHHSFRCVYKLIIKTTMDTNANLNPEQKKTWSTILKFAVEVIKLIIASFLGGSTATLIS